jgi:hypothetical protein
MGEIVTKFELTGICEVDVSEVVKQWDNAYWIISQWHDKYTLAGPKTKVVISKQQAKEIIVELDLMPVQSKLFRNGKTWKKPNQITPR